MNNVTLEPLNKDNWLIVCGLSVSDEQKAFFPISNLYWIAISRYEEFTELFAIKLDAEYVGLIGGGLDEDNVSGYINPLMADQNYQCRGIAKKAMLLMMDYLVSKFNVPKINIGHRRVNTAAGNLYESLGFKISSESEKDICRTYLVKF